MEKSRVRGKDHPPFPQILILILFLIALLCVVGLDYINWTAGNSSVLFRKPAPAALEEFPDEPGAPVLAEIVLKQLRTLDVPTYQKSQFWDDNGVFHLKVDIPEKDYLSLKNALEAEFATFRASIENRSRQEDSEKKHHLWHVTDRSGINLSLLVSCPKAPPPLERRPAADSPGGRVAVIVDDMGYSLTAMSDLCKMNQRLTISVLPNTPHAQDTARIANENGMEVLLHLPMESDDSDSAQNRVKGIVLSSMKKQQIIDIFANDLAQVPYARGVNNHMGSRITRNGQIMKTVLDQVKKNNLFFVDSVTTGETLAYDMAKSMDIPTARRQVFLDGILTEEYISAQMEELFEKAKIMGSAIGICHPSEVAFKVLSDKLPEIKKRGMRLVFASEIAQ